LLSGISGMIEEEMKNREEILNMFGELNEKFNE
jgi:hypothetical protein